MNHYYLSLHHNHHEEAEANDSVIPWPLSNVGLCCIINKSALNKIIITRSLWPKEIEAEESFNFELIAALSNHSNVPGNKI